VSSYSDTSESSICKSCHDRRLIKFKKASDHLEELTQKLKGILIYKDRKVPTTKRLLSEDNNGKTAETCPGKAAKCVYGFRVIGRLPLVPL